jgi:hypothetical protein
VGGDGSLLRGLLFSMATSSGRGQSLTGLGSSESSSSAWLSSFGRGQSLIGLGSLEGSSSACLSSSGHGNSLIGLGREPS